MVKEFKVKNDMARKLCVALALCVSVVSVMTLAGCGEKNSPEKQYLQEQSDKLDYAAKHPEIQEQKAAKEKADAAAQQAKCGQEVKSGGKLSLECDGPRPAPGAS
ncbi:MAG: hypothetical protein EPN79_10655 [Burkholderiaceae bacterium]|nr:MAG: hypothetical protein EPN79_10655 [Burkholderiaceae bacterium]TBR76852.1 MAG: hypothetical protein EPN64_06420 [Burkholderiaceae bacterium]